MMVTIWIKRRYSTADFGSVSTEKFVRLAERVSGKQLDRLFRVWLYVPEKPKGY